MTNSLYLLLLAIISFLYALNLFLRGSYKSSIEAILGLSMVITVIVSFFVFNWKWGILYLVSPFVFVGLSRPIAELVAFKLLGYRTGVDDNSESIDGLLTQMASGEEGFTKALKDIGRESDKNNQRLSSIAKKSTIAAILKKHNIPSDEYRNLFMSLWSSALHNMAWDIVSTPRDLEILIQMKAKGASDVDVWSHFRESGMRNP